MSAKELEMAYIRATVRAQRAMRTATSELGNQEAYDAWQQAEVSAEEARKAWQVACEMERRQAA